MNEYDLYDFFSYTGYKAKALTMQERGGLYISNNTQWFSTIPTNAATVLQQLGYQFAVEGTNAIENPAFWQLPAIRNAGGFNALNTIGTPNQVIKDAKGRLFGI
jgi:type I restriction enzyme R subunit